MVIKQRTTNDCGIASLANLFGLTYKEVNRIVRDDTKARGEKFDGTDIDHARAVAAYTGENIRLWYVNDENRQILREKLRGRPAVLVVPAIGHPDEFHALYWDSKRIHDPGGPGGYGAKGLKAFKKMREIWVIESDAI